MKRKDGREIGVGGCGGTMSAAAATAARNGPRDGSRSPDNWERISEKQDECLFPLKEDLATWLNKTLGENSITADNFMDVLDNGVLVCRLAKLIHDRAAKVKNLPVVPAFKFKCWQHAQSASFFARDNTENFLKWCRQIGIKDAVMFESESLVLQTQPRTVILCLLELARIAAPYGIDPPGIVKLEREIDNKLNEKNVTRRPLSVSVPTTPCLGESLSSLRKSSLVGVDVVDTMMMTTTTMRPSTAPRYRREGCSSVSEGAVVRMRSVREEPDSKLHRKVLQIAGNSCSKSHIQHISAGKYIIGGKMVYIRLLNDRHVMVRVGGGWDTFEHFVSRHDPCLDFKRPILAVDSDRKVVSDEEWQQQQQLPRSRRPSKSSSASAVNGEGGGGRNGSIVC